jgi:hypothetical protein
MTVSGPTYTHERLEYYGIIGDTKPSGVPKGSRYIQYSSDDSSTIIFFTPDDGTTWKTLAQTK